MPVLQLEKNCVHFFTDFSADARSEKCKITLVATFMDICFSLPRSIPAIAEKRTQKIAGTRSSKFVFYGINSHNVLLIKWLDPRQVRPCDDCMLDLPSRGAL